MTVLTDNETQELQRKIERLANALVTPAQCNEWSQHFRIDTDLQGVKALLSQKRSHLSYSSLLEWQQNEVLASIAQVESCVMRMEVNHTNPEHVWSVVNASVTKVLMTTLDEIRKGKIFTGPSEAVLQTAVEWFDRTEILDVVFQRANLEALDSEEAIKKHIVAVIAGLVQKEMVRSVESLSGY